MGRIRDPEKTHPGSRIQGSKKHRIPDPDPQHWSKVVSIDRPPFKVFMPRISAKPVQPPSCERPREIQQRTASILCKE